MDRGSRNSLLVAAAIIVAALIVSSANYYAWQSAVSQTKAQLDDSNQELATIETQLGALGTAVGELNSSSSARAAQANISMASISSRLTALRAAVAQLNSSAAGQKMTLGNLESQVSTLQSWLNGSNSSSLSQQIGSVEFEVSNLQLALVGCSGTSQAPEGYVGANGTWVEPVLVLNPGTSATVCVTYETAWAQNSTVYQVLASQLRSLHPAWASCNFSLTIFNENYSAKGFFTYSGTHSFWTVARPYEVDLAPALGYFTVVYQVTALKNSTGFYDYLAPTGGWSLPLAVGHSPSRVNASDFRSLYWPTSGPYIPTPMSSYAVSVGGFDYAWITCESAVGFCSG